MFWRSLNQPRLRMICLACLLGASAAAGSVVVDIPLPDLNGPLHEGARMRSMSYDLGVEFLEIEYMHVTADIQASSTVLKRLDTGELVYRPGLIMFSVAGKIIYSGQLFDTQRHTGMHILDMDPSIALSLDLAVGWPFIIVNNQDSVRVSSTTLMPSDSALNGINSGEVPASFGQAIATISLWGVYFSDVAAERLAYPEAVVSHARLIVCGTIVPEPAVSLLLLIAPIAGLRQSRRR